MVGIRKLGVSGEEGRLGRHCAPSENERQERKRKMSAKYISTFSGNGP